jgi:hypothetical protein
LPPRVCETPDGEIVNFRCSVDPRFRCARCMTWWMPPSVGCAGIFLPIQRVIGHAEPRR